MTFSSTLKEELKSFHLLNHPFYQDWNKGTLRIETLQNYAKQYYHHVKAFPRYISATHSGCENLEQRRVLLENLMDEEGFNGTDHPTLWKQFALGLGVSTEELNSTSLNSSIKNVISTFLTAGKDSYHEGLASLYAYEYQVPEVADSKIEGLKKNYNINSDETLEFFTVHKTADLHHRKTCEVLLDNLNKQEQSTALSAAKKSAKSLWDFLTDIHSCEPNAA